MSFARWLRTRHDDQGAPRMPVRFRLRTVTPALWLTLLVLMSASDPSAGIERLRAMPLERRTQLAEKLATFDALPSNQKSAVRSFDSRVQELEPDKRDDYLKLLRRYHLWRRSLTDAQRKKIDDAPTPTTRIKIVETLREEQRKRVSAEIEKANWIQISSLNELTLFWSAHHLVIWFLLDDAERTQVDKIPDRAARLTRLREIGQKKKAKKAFQHIDQEFQSDIDGVIKQMEQQAAARGQPQPKDAIKKKGQIINKSSPFTRKVELKFLTNHQNPKVDAKHLSWFEQECPNWLRESLDSLPPEAARRRLAVLYRLVFPDGTEIPEPKRKASPPSPAPRTSETPPPRPRPPDSGNVPL
jgi:hypothetical protein